MGASRTCRNQGKPSDWEGETLVSTVARHTNRPAGPWRTPGLIETHCRPTVLPARAGSGSHSLSLRVGSPRHLRNVTSSAVVWAKPLVMRSRRLNMPQWDAEWVAAGKPKGSGQGLFPQQNCT